MTEYGNNICKLKKNEFDDSKIILKSERNSIPTLIAYNGSGFDFHFILKRFLNDKTCSKRFEIKNIYKGSCLIQLIVFDRYCDSPVLKTHDMFQILGCSLKKSLTGFCKTSNQA